MQIRQLECFRTLMLHGTMTRAAELLGISQPAVSNIIASLEHDIGFALFVRRAGRVHPTAEARLLYVEATRALDAIENTARIAGEISKGKHGHLSIAAYPAISTALLPRLVSLFIESRPEVTVKIISRDSRTVRELVLTQQFDLAICELPLDYPAASMDVFSYACECMLPADHALVSRAVITPADLDDVPFVTLFRGDPLYQQMQAAFSRAGARWRVVAETEYFSTACELVSAGVGVGIVDPVVSVPFTAHVVRRPFLPKIAYEIAILYPTGSERSAIAEAFAGLLRAHLKER
jgi:DNA-binding transcriptional LysR family regulator